MSIDNQAVFILVALRKAVLLRDQYNSAMIALAESLAGENLAKVSGEHWEAMESTIQSLMGQDGNYGDIGHESVAMLKADWAGVQL